MNLPPLIELQGTSIRIGSFLWDPADKNPLIIGKIAKIIFGSESTLIDTSSRKSVQCLRQHLLESSVNDALTASKYLDTASKLKQWISGISPEHFEAAWSFAEATLQFIEKKDPLNISPTSYPCLPLHLIDDPNTLRLIPTTLPTNSPFSKNRKLAQRVQHLIIDDPEFKHFSGKISPIVKQSLEPLYPTLVELTLNNLGLLWVPAELKNLVSLETLNLNSNSIAILEDVLPPSLVNLHCIDNPIAVISSAIHSHFVYISFNNLWPRGIYHLHPVEELDITDIPAGPLHPEFVKLTSLNQLLLDNEFPVQVAPLKNLSNLESLWINHPDFEDVFTLTQLRVIGIDDKHSREARTTSFPTVTLPSSIGNMQNLVGLFFNYWCQLTIPPEITLCSRLNFLSRLHLRNRLMSNGRKTRFIHKWLKGPFPDRVFFSEDPIIFNYKLDLFKLPTCPKHSAFTTKQKLLDVLVKSQTEVQIYEVELSTDFSEFYRTHVYLIIPTQLYNEYFRTYKIAYTNDPQEGLEFQRDTLKTLFQFLLKKSDEFARDASNDEDAFYEAFIEGKIWYDETNTRAGFDIKGAWRPKKQDGTFLVPDRKTLRDFQIHYFTFPQWIPNNFSCLGSS